jgi:hypothetical protein
MLPVFTRAATLLKPHYRPNADLLEYTDAVCMMQKQASLFRQSGGFYLLA